MDEITLLRAIRPDSAGFSDDERGEVLCRLLAAAAGERSRGQAGLGRPGRRSLLTTWRPWQRWATPGLARGAAVIGALAIAAAGLTALTLPLNGRGPATGAPGARPGQPGPSSVPQLLSGAGNTGPMPTPTSLPSGQGPPATAAALLQRAAQAAAATPDLVPEPGRFVYTEVLTVGEEELPENANGTTATTPLKTPPYIVRTWLSADGRGGAANQVIAPGGQWNTVSPPTSLCPLNWQNCDPGYLANLPGTVSGMLSYVLTQGSPTGPAAYRFLTGMITSSWIDDELMPNQGNALMYQALATVKGIYLIPHVTDSAGRAGIAVAACVPPAIDAPSLQRYSCPEHFEMIFDPRTYEFIGFSDVTATGTSGGLGNESLLGIAVVSKAGQLP
jgi:hypothetical protein